MCSRFLSRFLMLMPFLWGTLACGPKGNQPNIEIIQDMMVQPAVKSQRPEPFFEDGIGSRVPPSNTRPIGFKPYAYPADILAAEKELKNPFSESTGEVLLTGQKYYETNCAVCHGYSGKGDGPVTPKYPLPIPSLVVDKAKAYTDGRFYHIITVGQGTMGPYASHVPQQYRWQVVSYIRHLQNQKD